MIKHRKLISFLAVFALAVGFFSTNLANATAANTPLSTVSANTIFCYGTVDCPGTNGVDHMWGDFMSNNMFAKGGADIMAGGDGNDKLSAGSGSDQVLGEAGKDRIQGGGSADVLMGGGSRDKLMGGGGNDDISGNGGNDQLFGDSGDDTLDGGAGEDTCTGSYTDTYIRCEHITFVY